MKTYEERTENILSKVKAMKRRKRTVTATVILSVCLVLGLVLFTPYPNSPPDVTRYAASAYYPLIQKLNQAAYQPPEIKNNFQYLWQALELGNKYASTEALPESPPMTNAPSDDGSLGGENYVETTDNQVAGVVEADLIKRTTTHIFYLRGNTVTAYSIAGEKSAYIGDFAVQNGENSWYSSSEMYLSQDGTRLTLFMVGYGDELTEQTKQAYTCIVSLDVSDPANIREVGRQYLTGSYLSSRQVDGSFLVMSLFYVEDGLDFDQEATFVPQYGQPGHMASVAAEDIVIPESVSSLRYTVVMLLDEKSLEVSDSAALLSYTSELYVSQDNIFATYPYSENVSANVSKTVTEITGLSYSGGTLGKIGTVKLDGAVKNQYSMDEFEGILRVVTSTTETTYETVTGIDSSYLRTLETKRNVNLYCVDLTDFSVAAKVEAFAPQGETAESVRFEGHTAYVCTAEVITLTDPVYFFDLSDLENITWKDTGTIDGYSSSLVNFGDYLLGIGFNENRELKIEIYRETETGVASLCSYERTASFSQDYKSYFIDRENQLIGLGIYGGEVGGTCYLLLSFDGVQFRELATVPISDSYWGLDQMRGLVIDGWLYVLGIDFFEVVKIG